MKKTRKNIAVAMQLSFIAICGFGSYVKIIRLDNPFVLIIAGIIFSLTLVYENWDKPYAPIAETCKTLFVQAIVIIGICVALKLMNIESLPDKTLMLYAALTYIIAIVSEITPHIRVLIRDTDLGATDNHLGEKSEGDMVDVNGLVWPQSEIERRDKILDGVRERLYGAQVNTKGPRSTVIMKAADDGTPEYNLACQTFEAILSDDERKNVEVITTEQFNQRFVDENLLLPFMSYGERLAMARCFKAKVQKPNWPTRCKWWFAARTRFTTRRGRAAGNIIKVWTSKNKK